MTDFIGNEGNNIANAATGVLGGFTGGNEDQLTDSVGDSFEGGDGTLSSPPMPTTRLKGAKVMTC